MALTCPPAAAGTRPRPRISRPVADLRGKQADTQQRVRGLNPLTRGGERVVVYIYIYIYTRPRISRPVADLRET